MPPKAVFWEMTFHREDSGVSIIGKGDHRVDGGGHQDGVKKKASTLCARLIRRTAVVVMATSDVWACHADHKEK